MLRIELRTSTLPRLRSTTEPHGLKYLKNKLYMTKKSQVTLLEALTFIFIKTYLFLSYQTISGLSKKLILI